MNYKNRLKISYYQNISSINNAKNVFIVKHIENNKIYIKKILSLYNKQIYEYIYNNPIEGIPQIFEIYEENNELTIIEEFISGNTLNNLIENNIIINHTSFSNIIIKICDILNILHNAKPPIIHRDLKPNNIIVKEHNSNFNQNFLKNEIYLIDLNAAKIYNPSDIQDTILLGTEGYAAPEQYGFGSSNPSTDIYAIGNIMKNLLPITNIETNAKNKLSNIIAKCLEIDYKKRYQNISELKKALLQIDVISSETHSKIPILNFFTLPGFRTGNFIKSIIGMIGYFLLFYSCFYLDTNSNDIAVNISIFLIGLSTIFCFFNYLNIQKLMPLCKNENIIIRFIGICILCFILYIVVFIIFILIPYN